MRSSTNTSNRSHDPAEHSRATSMDIPSPSNLTITLNLTHYTKPRTPKPYRAVQRPDGVVITYPLFRPSPPPEFEPRIPIFTVPEPTSSEAPRKGKGKGKDEGRTRCGRGGYNSPKKENVVMQRWLEEEGPWCGLDVASCGNKE